MNSRNQSEIAQILLKLLESHVTSLFFSSGLLFHDALLSKETQMIVLVVEGSKLWLSLNIYTTRLELCRNPEVSNQFNLKCLYAPVKVPSVRKTLLRATAKSKTPLRKSPEAFTSLYKVLVKLGAVYLLPTSFRIEPCSCAIDTLAIAHSSSACLPSI